MKSVWIFPSHIPPGYCREYNLEPGSRQELNYGLEWKGLRFLFTYSVLRPGRTGHLAILLSEDKHSNFRQHNGWKSLIFWVPLRSLSTSFSWITDCKEMFHIILHHRNAWWQFNSLFLQHLGTLCARITIAQLCAKFSTSYFYYSSLSYRFLESLCTPQLSQDFPSPRSL